MLMFTFVPWRVASGQQQKKGRIVEGGKISSACTRGRLWVKTS